MHDTNPKLVDPSNQLQLELSRWETEGGAVGGPPEGGFRREASPLTRHSAGKSVRHVARTRSNLLEKWRSLFHRGSLRGHHAVMTNWVVSRFSGGDDEYRFLRR